MSISWMASSADLIGASIDFGYLKKAREGGGTEVRREERGGYRGI